MATCTVVVVVVGAAAAAAVQDHHVLACMSLCLVDLC